MARQNPYKRPDRFTREAKERGFPARSVFKLEEIDRKVSLLRKGQRVLDLGAAPGSWSLYAAEKIGPSGKLLSIDLNPLAKAGPSHMTFRTGDALAIDSADLALFAPYDVVLSDMAPNTTGTREADQAKSFELFARALDVAGALLRPGGKFVGKIFMGPDFPEAKKRVKALFETERAIRPAGTRESSFEIFLVGLGKR
jgi:23S rRNA (uridine2552-2'-O)-methyltransferase